MDGIFHHHLKLALPLIAVFVAILLGLLAANGAWQIATLHTMPGSTTAFIGDGIDVFTAVSGPRTATFLQAISDNGDVLTIIVLVATAISIVEAVRRLMAKLRAPDNEILAAVSKSVFRPNLARTSGDTAAWRMPAHAAFVVGALTVPVFAVGAGTFGVVVAAAFGVSGAINLLTDRR